MEFKEVRTILLQQWDPLDVGDNPNLADEYDSFLPELLKLIKAGRTSHEIAKHLKGIEDNLGISLLPERRTKAAMLLAKK